MLKKIHISKNFKYEFADINKTSLVLINQEIIQLSHIYPNIKQWYTQKFSPSFLAGERSIILSYHENDLAGFVLMKNTFLEKKICTFFIAPPYREAGLGKCLMPLAISALGEKDILITVSENTSKNLEHLLYVNDFVLTKTDSGLYLPNKKEFFYELKG